MGWVTGEWVTRRAAVTHGRGSPGTGSLGCGVTTRDGTAWDRVTRGWGDAAWVLHLEPHASTGQDPGHQPPCPPAWGSRGVTVWGPHMLSPSNWHPPGSRAQVSLSLSAGLPMVPIFSHYPLRSPSPLGVPIVPWGPHYPWGPHCPLGAHHPSGPHHPTGPHCPQGPHSPGPHSPSPMPWCQQHPPSTALLLGALSSPWKRQRAGSERDTRWVPSSRSSPGWGQSQVPPRHPHPP